MISKRFYAVVAGIAVTAVACGGAVSGGDETSSSPFDGVASDNVELLSPTDTDRPFDLSGGATSSERPGGSLGSGCRLSLLASR